MTTPFANRALDILREYCANNYNGNVRATAQAIGLDPNAGVLHRWLSGGQWPRLDLIGPCLDRVGVEVVAPWEVVRGAPSSETVARLQREIAQQKSDLEKARDTISELRGEVKALERVLCREGFREKNF